MSINSNSIWNFAEKHPFLFYSCVSSIVGGTVKIVRTLKGEPKPVSVMVSDVMADKTKNAVKEVVKSASEKLLMEDKKTDNPTTCGVDVENEPPEAHARFCAFELDTDIRMGDPLLIDEIMANFKDYIDLWDELPLSEIRGYCSGTTVVRPCDYDWGWSKEEFDTQHELHGNLLILPPPHKLETAN